MTIEPGVEPPAPPVPPLPPVEAELELLELLELTAEDELLDAFDDVVVVAVVESSSPHAPPMRNAAPPTANHFQLVIIKLSPVERTAWVPTLDTGALSSRLHCLPQNERESPLPLCW
jgi:hypothetical protein